MDVFALKPGKRLLILAMAVAVLGGGETARAQGPSLEFAIKAAFLTKFAAFINWPGGIAADEPMRICVVGDDEVGAKLAQSVQGALGPRPVQVRRLPAIDGATDCRIVYVAGSGRQSVADALAAVRGAPVLTVTDGARGPARGVIHFIVFEDRVRFHVDAAQAAQNGIGVSSKLMALALSVKR